MEVNLAAATTVFPFYGVVPSLPILLYLPRSPENTRATACRVRVDILQETYSIHILEYPRTLVQYVQNFLSHLDTLKYIVTSYITGYSSYSISLVVSLCLFITHYDSSTSVEHLLTIMLFDSDSLSSVEHLLTMMPLDSSLYAEQLCDRVLLNGNSFNSLSFVEQTRKVGICFVAFISVITG